MKFFFDLARKNICPLHKILGTCVLKNKCSFLLDKYFKHIYKKNIALIRFAWSPKKVFQASTSRQPRNWTSFPCFEIHFKAHILLMQCNKILVPSKCCGLCFPLNWKVHYKAPAFQKLVNPTIVLSDLVSHTYNSFQTLFFFGKHCLSHQDSIRLTSLIMLHGLL